MMLNSNKFQSCQTNGIINVPFPSSQIKQSQFGNFQQKFSNSAIQIPKKTQIDSIKPPNQFLPIQNSQENKQQNLIDEKFQKKEQNKRSPQYQAEKNCPPSIEKQFKIFSQPKHPQNNSQTFSSSQIFGNSFSTHLSQNIPQSNPKQQFPFSKHHSTQLLEPYREPQIAQTQQILPNNQQFQQFFINTAKLNKDQHMCQSAFLPSKIKIISQEKINPQIQQINQPNIQNQDSSLFKRQYQQNISKQIQMEQVKEEQVKEEQNLDDDYDVMKTQVVQCKQCQQSFKHNTISLNCQHLFHKECIEEHLTRLIQQKKMPACVCKKRIPYKQVQQIMQQNYDEILFQLDTILFDNLSQKIPWQIKFTYEKQKKEFRNK